MKYDIVCGNQEFVIREINKKLSDGWFLHGPTVSDSDSKNWLFSQAMLKGEPTVTGEVEVIFGYLEDAEYHETDMLEKGYRLLGCLDTGEKAGVAGVMLSMYVFVFLRKKND